MVLGRKGRPKKRGPDPKPKKKPPFAYTINDPQFGIFNLKNTANAWWLERAKVENLINAFKYSCPIKEALVYAGVTKDQWEYFRLKHPEISEIKEACYEIPNLKSRKKIVEDIEVNVSTAQWWAKNKMPDEFGDKSKVEVKHEINFSEEAEQRAKKYD